MLMVALMCSAAYAVNVYVEGTHHEIVDSQEKSCMQLVPTNTGKLTVITNDDVGISDDIYLRINEDEFLIDDEDQLIEGNAIDVASVIEENQLQKREGSCRK